METGIGLYLLTNRKQQVPLKERNYCIIIENRSI